MDSTSSDSGRRRPNFWIAYAVFAAGACAVAAYVYYFGYKSRSPLGGPEAWGQFGDYIGGLVNPVVGIVTVLLVVETLRVTRAEADETRKHLAQQTEQMALQVAHLKGEQVLAEMQKRLDGVLSAIQSAMAKSIPSLDRNLFGGAAPFPIESFADIVAEPGVRDLIVRLLQGPAAVAIQANWRTYSRGFVNLLGEMRAYCSEYDELATNKVLTDFYRNRVQILVEILNTANVIDPDVREDLLPSGPIY